MLVNPFSWFGHTAGTTVEAKIEQATTTEEVILPLPLKEVCGCESNWDPYSEPRQFDENGLPLQNKNYDKNGVHWSSDWGSCQINDYYWQDDATRLGLDYKHSKNDNYKLALHVFEQQGMGAWGNSGSCHKRK